MLYNKNWSLILTELWLNFTVPSSSIIIDLQLHKNNSIVLPNHGVITNMERITILLSQLQETDRRYHHTYTSNTLALGVLHSLSNPPFKDSSSDY